MLMTNDKRNRQRKKICVERVNDVDDRVFHSSFIKGEIDLYVENLRLYPLIDQFTFEKENRVINDRKFSGCRLSHPNL